MTFPADAGSSRDQGLGEMEPQAAASPDGDLRKLLVLAPSGAFGGGFRVPGARLWPDTVRDGLSATDGDIELVRQRFYVHAGSPFSFLERQLALEPDYIILHCTAFAATQRTVAHRLNRIFGQRTAGWTEARVRNIDSRTWGHGRTRERFNRASRRVARKVIGTDAVIGLEPLIEAYVEAIERIARCETAQVVVIGTAMPSKFAREGNRQIDKMVDRFDEALSAAARQKRFGWVDSQAITRSAPDPEATFLDPLHRGQQWHDGIAEAVLAAFAIQASKSSH